MSDRASGRTAHRWLDKIPGYAGYRDKENRRDADRAVRDRLVAELTARAERVERVASAMADQRRLAEVGPVNRAAEAIRLFADRVNTASYGYGGLFGQKDIDAAALDQLRLFDESVFASLEQLDVKVAAIEGTGDLTSALTELGGVVRQLSDHWELRSQVVESGIAATDAQMASVLAVLQTPEEMALAASPAPTYDLHDRDALSVLGDNYVVDARIDIEAASGFFRIFRIEVAPETWLLAPRTRGQSLALLKMSKEAYSPVPNPTIGAEEYVVESSGTGSGDVTGAGGQTERRPLAYTLLRGASEPSKRAAVLQWGNEQQILVGSNVHPDDVEVFGKPNSAPPTARNRPIAR